MGSDEEAGDVNAGSGPDAPAGSVEQAQREVEEAREELEQEKAELEEDREHLRREGERLEGGYEER